MVGSINDQKCLHCGGNRVSQPCFPIAGLDIEHYYSKEEYVAAVVEALWLERLERLEYKERSKSTPHSEPIPNKKARRKGGITL